MAPKYQDRHFMMVDYVMDLKGRPLRAFNFTAEVYKGKNRLSGRPVQDHFLEALRVGTMCGGMRHKQKRRIIVGIFLHDVYEDEYATAKEISSKFSRQAAIDSMALSKKGKKIDDYIRELLTDYVWTVIKLFDRIANLLDANAFPDKKYEDYLKETRVYFVPMIESAIRKYPKYRNILIYLRGELLARLEENERILKNRKDKKR